jgi:hypothetical protein
MFFLCAIIPHGDEQRKDDGIKAERLQWSKGKEE